MPEDLALGFKITAIRDLTLMLAFDIGLARSVALGIPATMPLDTFFTATFNVDPFVRGRGIGRELVAALESEARQLGATRVVLETGTRLKHAIRLYESTGYSRIPLFGEYRCSPDTSLCFGKTL